MANIVIVPRPGYEKAIITSKVTDISAYLEALDIYDITYVTVRGVPYYILENDNGNKCVVSIYKDNDDCLFDYETPWTPQPVANIQYIDDGWYAICSAYGTISGRLYNKPDEGSAWLTLCNQYLSPGGVQKFSGFPDSPFTKTAYPSQIIIQTSTYTGSYPVYQLLVTTWNGTNPFSCNETNLGGGIWAVATTYVYQKVGNSWVYQFTRYRGQYIWLRGPYIDMPILGLEGYIIACNCTLSWIRDGSTIYKYKTTSVADDNLPDTASYFNASLFKSSRGSFITTINDALFEWSSGSYWTKYYDEQYNGGLQTITVTKDEETLFWALPARGTALYLITSATPGQLTLTPLDLAFGAYSSDCILAFQVVAYLRGVKVTDPDFDPYEVTTTDLAMGYEVYQLDEDTVVLGECFSTPVNMDGRAADVWLPANNVLRLGVELDHCFDLFNAAYSDPPNTNSLLQLLGTIPSCTKLLPSIIEGYDICAFDRRNNSFYTVTINNIKTEIGRINL